MIKHRKIEVWYCIKSRPSPESNYASGSQRFTDWYDFADWLKQATLNGGPVLITSWNYV